MAVLLLASPPKGSFDIKNSPHSQCAPCLPARKLSPSCGSKAALVPGSSVLKMLPKSWFTLRQVASSASRFFSSSSAMTYRELAG